MAKPRFEGFPLGLLHFLNELSKHNNRTWFQANKARYEQELREPALAFIAAMEAPLSKVSSHFQAVPKKVGGSLMRIHRDVRFSKDKTPFKTNIGIQFRHEYAKDVHAPGFYLHIDNSGCFLAAGCWRPEPDALKKIRARIHERPRDWQKARDARGFKSLYVLGGSSLKRPPRGYRADDPMIEDLMRKDFVGSTEFSATDIEKRDFLRQCGGAFRKAAPLMGFLCAALEVPF